MSDKSKNGLPKDPQVPPEVPTEEKKAKGGATEEPEDSVFSRIRLLRFVPSLKLLAASVFSGVIAIWISGPLVINQIKEAKNEYIQASEEIKKQSVFWIEMNERYKEALKSEAEQIKSGANEVLEAYSDIKKRQNENIALTDEATFRTRWSIENLQATRSAFVADLLLFEKYCNYIFSTSNPHQTNPWNFVGRAENYSAANAAFDSLLTLREDLKNIKLTAEDVSPPKNKAQSDKLESLGGGVDISESNLFSGITIKLALAHYSNTDAERLRYCDEIRDLLRMYNERYVQRSSSAETGNLLPDEEYPGDLSEDTRRKFELNRLNCYYHFLRGSWETRLRLYRDALIDYQLAIDSDDARKNHDWSSLTFYRADYNAITVLETLLSRASLSATKTEQWSKDFAMLRELRNTLTDFFSQHPERQTDSSFFQLEIGALEWTAFQNEQTVSDWKEVDERSRTLLRIADKVPYGVLKSSDWNLLYTHRLTLKSIYSGYDTDYYALQQRNETPDGYTALQIDAIGRLHNSYLAFAKHDGTSAWKDELDKLLDKLQDPPDVREGYALGIILRLEADIKQILSSKDPDPFSMLKRKKGSADSSNDEIDTKIAKLAKAI
jgi:hypothetical protein